MNCSNSYVQEYQCQKQTRYGFACDMCLVDEVNLLNDIGIKTVGCCCGMHINSISDGYIQVLDENDALSMSNLGYELIPIDKYGNGVHCFKPNSKNKLKNGE